MCLAIPGKVLKINNEGNVLLRSGMVRFGAITKEVNLTMVPEVLVGDFVLVHVGVAINKIDREEARKTLDYLDIP